MRTHGLRFLALSIAGIFLLSAATAVAHEADGREPEVMEVSAVVPDGAAERAGIFVGDRILSWNDQKISTKEELEAFLRAHRPGDEVTLTLDRGGESLQVPLVFGERTNGEVSVGVSLGVAAETASDRSDGFTAGECAAWIASTYRISDVAADLELDLSKELEANRACVQYDTERMAEPIPQGWCDNVFKVHCSGLDLLAQIGDALVARCERLLSADLGIDLSDSQIWNTCGEQQVYDRYSHTGEPSDLEACRRIYVEHCGADLDG